MNYRAFWTFGMLASYFFSAVAVGDEKVDLTSLIKPYRTFITIKQFTMETNGEPESPVSNVRLEVTFPNQQVVFLPGEEQYWPIGNGQIQEINQTFELPWAYIQKDGFNFNIQIVRKGTRLEPCKFEVHQLSQFNRSYICRTDINWQVKQNTAEQHLDKEGVEIRVFTDRLIPAKTVPNDAIAILPKQE